MTKPSQSVGRPSERGRAHRKAQQHLNRLLPRPKVCYLGDYQPSPLLEKALLMLSFKDLPRWMKVFLECSMIFPNNKPFVPSSSTLSFYLGIRTVSKDTLSTSYLSTTRRPQNLLCPWPRPRSLWPFLATRRQDNEIKHLDDQSLDAPYGRLVQQSEILSSLEKTRL